MKESFSIWSSINILEEADFEPNEIPITNRNIELLVRAWQYLEEQDPDLVKFRKLMNSEEAINKVRDIIDGWADSAGMPRGRVVIHGMYYLTPIQERIIRIIEAAGIEVVFLIPYNRQYSYANEIWVLHYCEKNGFEPLEKWTRIGKDRGNVFGDLLEGKPVIDKGFDIIEFKNIAGFVDYISHVNNISNYYSPNSETANSIIEDYLPEVYGSRSLGSYPIGGFIYSLYKMWNPETQTISIDRKTLIDCMSSGWISYRGVPSDVMIADLEKILPFFEDCRTVRDWEERSNLLYCIHKDIISNFLSESEDPEECRWQNVLSNPFSNFSMFDVSRSHVEQILGMIKELLECAKILFGGSSSLKISDHVSRLLVALNRNIPEGYNSHEYDLAKALLDRIAEKGGERQYGVSDIVGALSSFLAERKQVDSDGRLVGWVRSMYDIEGNDGDVHICLCDNDGIPGGRPSYIWPLDFYFVETACKLRAKKDSRPLIGNVMFITETNMISNRYLIYSAFDSGNVTLSWISEEGGKIRPPSPYINLLSRMAGHKIGVYGLLNERELNAGFVSPIDPIPMCKLNQNNMIPESRIELSLCPRKYMYGYVLNENPTYTSEFHRSFAIGGLISSIKSLGNFGYSGIEVEENVFALFPFLNSVERRNIKDRIPKPRYESRTLYHNVNYTDMRFGIRFPRPLWDMIDGSDGIDIGEECIDVTSSKPSSDLCKYCPYSIKCKYSKIDGD